jgi:hypothetical protein
MMRRSIANTNVNCSITKHEKKRKRMGSGDRGHELNFDDEE